MEAFTLLRYWRTAAGTARATTRDPTFTARAASTPYSHYGDDGPYFDLELSFANHDGDAATPKDTESENAYSDEELSESGNDDVKLQFALTDCGISADDKLTAKSLTTEADDGLSDKHFTIKLKDTYASSDESKLAKELVQKYFKMLKPLCSRFSSRYLEKMKLSWEAAEAVLPGNLKSKHLGKSRSTSAAAAVVVSPPPGKITANNRRCDSLVELQDGIEGAILHCKRSFFNTSRDGESCVLTRSASDPSHDKPVIVAADSWASTALRSGDVIEIMVN